MQRAFALELKSLTQDGTFDGLASTYAGDPDSYNDIVDIGAFTRTLTSSKERPLLFEHRDAIGKVELTDSPQGLIARGRLSLELQKAKDAYVMLKDGIAKGLSIGYETIAAKYVGDVRHIVEVKLWEISLVLFPANESAVITGVKSARREKLTQLIADIRSVIPKS